MADLPLNRIVRLFILIAACALVSLLVGQILFPGNFKTIIAGWIILSILVLMIPLLSWYLQAKTEATPRKDVISIFVSIASSLILIGSLGLAWLSLDSTQQQTQKNLKLSTATLENARLEQRSRRFMEALEKLGGESSYQRLAGVVAFQKLDEEFMSETDWRADPNRKEADREPDRREHWLIMGVLTDFIQAQVLWGEQVPTRKPSTGERAEVRAALNYLGRRKLTMNNGERSALDLSFINLTGYKLSRTEHIDCADPDPNVVPVNFEYVDFSNGNFERIELKCVNLVGAKFKNANLRNARLDFADLSGVDFTGADLKGAWLREATCKECETLADASTDASTVCPRNFRNESGKCVPIGPPNPTPDSSPTPIVAASPTP